MDERPLEHEDVAGNVIVCQGPPICLLSGDEAVAHQQAGCVWCRRITVFTDGTENSKEPARS